MSKESERHDDIDTHLQRPLTTRLLPLLCLRYPLLAWGVIEIYVNAGPESGDQALTCGAFPAFSAADLSPKS